MKIRQWVGNLVWKLITNNPDRVRAELDRIERERVQRAREIYEASSSRIAEMTEKMPGGFVKVLPDGGFAPLDLNPVTDPTDWQRLYREKAGDLAQAQLDRLILREALQAILDAFPASSPLGSHVLTAQVPSFRVDQWRKLVASPQPEKDNGCSTDVAGAATRT